MPDTPPLPEKTDDDKPGWGKAISAWLSLESTNELAPMVVTYLHAHFAVITDEQILHILSFIQATLISGVVWFTPHNIVDAITDGILFVRRSFAKWRKASNEKVDE